MAQVSYGTITITDNNDIEKIYMQYAQSTSNQVAPTSSSDWSTDIPTWRQGYYIWQRTVTKMSGVPLSSSSYGDPVCLTGSTGSTGTTGRGVSSIVTTYCNYGTGTPAADYSGWSTTVPAYDSSKPNYWVKTVITYTSGTPATDTTIYKDNGITSANSTAAAANSTAQTASGKADEAWNKADNAQTVASNASSAISNLNQYFWRKQTASTNVPAGSYVTNIPGTNYEANPASGGYNSLVQADGIYLRNGITTLSSWTGSALTFNNPSNGSKVIELGSVSNVPTLSFYNPSNNTIPMMRLSTNALTFGKPSDGQVQLTIGANGALQSGDFSITANTSTFASLGTKIDLTYGEIYTPYFRVSQGSVSGGPAAGVYITGNFESTQANIGGTKPWVIKTFKDSKQINLASITGPNSSFIQLGSSGSWLLHSNKIHTAWYISGNYLEYPLLNEKYYDFGMNLPTSLSDKFLYIRYNTGTNLSSIYQNDTNWVYPFYIDASGNVHAPAYYVGSEPLTGGVGSIAEKIINSDSTYGKGSATQPVYIDSNGRPATTTYALNAAGAKGVVTDLANNTTSTNLPTAAAVVSYVTSRGYITSYTDNKVQTSQANTTKIYLTGTATTGTSTGTLNFDSNVYLTTTAGTLHATTFEGNLSGTATKANQDGDGNVIKSTYLKLSGGNVTGAVMFGSSVSVDELTAGNLVVNGNASFTNNAQFNTINGVTVGSNPKFTDTVTTVSVTGSGNAVTSASATNGALTLTKGTTFLTSHQTVSNKAATLAWNSLVTVATIGGTDITVKLPSNPDTNTIYTIGTGDSNGQIKVTPSSGDAYNVSVKGWTSWLPLAGGTMTGGITFNKVNNAISYTGSQATYAMIKFKDNTNDTYGNGIVIGGGGLTVIGGGESADTIAAQYSSGGDESMLIGSDGGVIVMTNVQDGYANRKTFSFGTDGTFNAPTNITINGVSVLTSHQDISGKADKSTTVTNVAYSSKKITKTINGTTSDVVTAATLKTDMDLNNVTNNAQVKGLASGTTSGHLVSWGVDGYTVADSGIANTNIVSNVRSNTNGQLVLTYADGNDSQPIDVEFVATVASSASKADSLTTTGTIITNLGTTGTGAAKTYTSGGNIEPGVKGTLGVGFGGTGKTSWTQWGIIYASATGTLAQVTAGASGNSGYLLQSNGAAAPGWIQATNSNTANTIVKRDGSGNFSAGTITATLSGNASSATKANLTTTTNAIAYYTDTAGTFGSKASANGALYATSANGALQWGTLPAAQGGTGKTSLKDACNALINALETGSSNLTASDYVITQYVGGGTTTTTYHRRPASAMRVGGLLTARKLKVALGSTTDVTFDGTADVTNIPISGTLGVSYGGTGATNKRTAGLIYDWTATIQGQKWSRVCYVPVSTTTVGSNFFLNVRGTRGSVVYNYTFNITTNHDGNDHCDITALSGSQYSALKIRGVTGSGGDCYIELYDDANSIASGTTQSVYCHLYILTKGSTEPTLYTAFTDGTTIPSNYKTKELNLAAAGGVQITGNFYGNLKGNADTATSATSATNATNADSAAIATKLKQTAVTGQDNCMPSTGDEFQVFRTTTDATGGDGHIMAFNWANTNAYGAQLFIDTDPTYNLSIRQRDSAGTWKAWKRIITENNYNSFSPTLTGTGASGNWDINITGNAATATTATTATTADKLTGFSSRNTSYSWGNQTGTGLTRMDTPAGGSIIFRDDNPASGQTSMLIDGTIYIKEGNTNVGDAIKSITRSGTTFTYTTLWGSTGTFTQQDSDTKNTAGSTNTDSALFLVGATSQAANPQTYSHDTVKINTTGQIISTGYEMTTSSSMSNAKCQMRYEDSLQAIVFSFA